MDFKEFQAFGRTNPVFLAVGHRMQTKLRPQAFGRQYWIDQTKKRRDRYNFDKKFEADMEKYVSLRYGDMPPVERKSRASFGSRTATPATPKKKEAAVDFWGEFPEVYQQVLAQIKREEGEKATLGCLAPDDAGRAPWEIDQGRGDAVWRCSFTGRLFFKMES